jgi:outer membrane protein assembly factor BamA
LTSAAAHCARAASRSTPAVAHLAQLLTRLVAWLFITVLAQLAAGCGARQSTEEQPRIAVHAVEFEGVSAFDPDEIVAALALQPNVPNPFVSRRWFDAREVEADRARVETFYHQRGFFDARVVDSRVVFDETSRRDQVTITWVVEEGQPAFITRVSYDVARLRNVDTLELIDELGVRVGGRYDEPTISAARDTLRRRLQESSYAYARADVQVYADRAARTVEVFFFFDQGPACLFGRIDVQGNRQIPAELVRDRMRLQDGNTYRHSLLRLSQVSLYDMNAFTFVGVDADLEESDADGRIRSGFASAETAGQRAAHFDLLDAMRAKNERRGLEQVAELRDPTSLDVAVASLRDNLGELDRRDPHVRIIVTVIEAPGASYRVGGGLGIESGRTETYARGASTWRNVAAPLNQVELSGRAGYAWLPTLFTRDRDIQGLIGGAKLAYSRPGAVFSYFDFSTSVAFERDFEVDYGFRRPSASIGLDRRLTESTTLGIAYTFDAYTTEREALANSGGSCQAIPERYELSTIGVDVQTDRRDRPLQAWEGYYFEASARSGMDFLVGDFPFLLIRPEFRWYQPIGSSISVAMRVATGLLFDFGDNVPRSECLYLGGGDSVRGFADRHLSPTDDGTLVGGRTSYLFNVEPRYELGRDWLFVVAFLDGGSVARNEADYRFSLGGAEGLHLATGGGLRLVTPIGPIRFDLGYRLTTGPQYADRTRSRFAFFLSIGEAF